MDEDNPEPSLTGPRGEEALENKENSGMDDKASAGSNLDILAIAESHREKSKSQQDLKRQFEEFSRNLSFGRTRQARKHRGGGGGGGHGHQGRQHRKSLDVPRISVEPSAEGGSDGTVDAEEAEEAVDQVRWIKVHLCSPPQHSC